VRESIKTPIVSPEENVKIRQPSPAATSNVFPSAMMMVFPCSLTLIVTVETSSAAKDREKGNTENTKKVKHAIMLRSLVATPSGLFSILFIFISLVF
jgi:hypothetical protein